MPQAQSYTYEELVKMGAKPTPAEPESYTYEQLLQLGATPGEPAVMPGVIGGSSSVVRPAGPPSVTIPFNDTRALDQLPQPKPLNIFNPPPDPEAEAARLRMKVADQNEKNLQAGGPLSGRDVFNATVDAIPENVQQTWMNDFSMLYPEQQERVGQAIEAMTEPTNLALMIGVGAANMTPFGPLVDQALASYFAFDMGKAAGDAQSRSNETLRRAAAAKTPQERAQLERQAKLENGEALASGLFAILAFAGAKKTAGITRNASEIAQVRRSLPETLREDFDSVMNGAPVPVAEALQKILKTLPPETRVRIVEDAKAKFDRLKQETRFRDPQTRVAPIEKQASGAPVDPNLAAMRERELTRERYEPPASDQLGPEFVQGALPDMEVAAAPEGPAFHIVPVENDMFAVVDSTGREIARVDSPAGAESIRAAFENPEFVPENQSSKIEDYRGYARDILIDPALADDARSVTTAYGDAELAIPVGGDRTYGFIDGDVVEQLKGYPGYPRVRFGRNELGEAFTEWGADRPKISTGEFPVNSPRALEDHRVIGDALGYRPDRIQEHIDSLKRQEVVPAGSSIEKPPAAITPEQVPAQVAPEEVAPDIAPPVARGPTITVYRGKNRTPMSDSARAGGRWFTESRSQAEKYKGPNGELITLEIPRDVWEQAKKAPEVERYSSEKDEGFIPEEWLHGTGEPPAITPAEVPASSTPEIPKAAIAPKKVRVRKQTKKAPPETAPPAESPEVVELRAKLAELEKQAAERESRRLKEEEKKAQADPVPPANESETSAEAALEEVRRALVGGSTRKPAGIMALLKEAGGIKDEGGEIGKLEIPWVKLPTNKNGLSLDRAVELAIEEGYMPGYEGGIADKMEARQRLIDLIDEESRGGKPTRSIQEDPVLEQMRAEDFPELGLNQAEIDRAIKTDGGNPNYLKIRKALAEKIDAEGAARAAPESVVDDDLDFDPEKMEQEFQHSMAGGGEVAEPSRTRPTLPNPTSAAPATPTTPAGIVRKSEIVKQLAEKLNIPIRVGRFSQRAWGIFKIKPEVIRSRIALDIATISHEIGHMINKVMYGTTGSDKTLALDWSAFAPFQGELAPIATKPRAGQSNIPEGFAEYLRLFLTDPTEATRVAPTFDAFFKQEIQRFPEIRSALETAQADIKRWIDQPDLAKVMSTIDFEAPVNRAYGWYDFYRDVIDRYEPLRMAEEAMGKVSSDKSAYKAAQLFSGWVGKADTFLQKGTFNPRWNRINGKSLKSIIEKLDGRLKEFSSYLRSLRDIEKMKQQIETGGPGLAESQRVVKELEQAHPDFVQAAKDLYAYQDALVDYLKERGIVSAEQVKKMREMNRNYVPFYRVFEHETGRNAMRRGSTDTFGNQGTPIKRMKGGGEDIIDPLESIIKNTFAFINLAERNEVARKFVDHAKAVDGGGKFAERVPPKMQPTEFMLADIKKALAQAGVDLDNTNLNVIAEVFRPAAETGGKDNILMVMRNGKREYYQVNPDVYRALQGLDEAGTMFLVRVFSIPAQTLRLGATALSPEFAFRNPLRDALTAYMQSEYGFIPGVDTIRGLFSAVKRDDLYWEWKRSGGEHAAMVSLDRRVLQENLKDLMASKGGWAVRHPIEALKMLSEFGESATRLGEYKKARLAGATPEDAALASRKVSVDFARRGAATKAVNQLAAFWNANVQGIDQFARLHKDPRTRRRSMIRGTVGLTIPSMILYAINADDPKYKELPRWRKDLFWNIPTGDEKVPFIAIPKPFEWGLVYSTIPERIAEFIRTQDKAAFDDLIRTTTTTVLPIPFPSAVVGPLEGFSDKSWFTGRPIVPDYLKRLTPEKRFDYRTSSFSVLMSRALSAFYKRTGVDVRVSPMKLDNALFSVTGGAGRLGADITDIPLDPLSGRPSDPEKTWSDYPVLRGFIPRYPGSTESVQKLYNRLNELQEIKDTVRADAKGIIPDSTPMTGPDAREYAILESAARTIAKKRTQQRADNASDTLTRKQKRESMDRIDLEIAEIARKAVADSKK